MSDVPNIEIKLPEAANASLPDPGLLEFYKGLEDRVYWLTGDITDDTLELAQYILRWNKEDAGKSKKERTPIKIIIDSNGGYISVAQTISYLISISKTPVYGIALSYVASASTLIYLSCHKKFALPNSCFILHKGRCDNYGGTIDEFNAFTEDYKIQIQSIMDFYQKTTKFSKKEIEKNIQTDWYIRLPLAEKKGMVDEVIHDIDIFC